MGISCETVFGLSFQSDVDAVLKTDQNDIKSTGKDKLMKSQLLCLSIFKT